MRIRSAVTAAIFVIGGAVPVAAGGSTAAASAARAGLCAPPADTVPPVITRATFGRSSIDLNSGSRTQTVAVRAVDASGTGSPSGVTSVHVTVRGGRPLVHLKLTSGTTTAGVWTGQFVVSRYEPAILHTIESARVVDAAGNDQIYHDYLPSHSPPLEPNDLLLPRTRGSATTFDVTGTSTPPRRPGRLAALSLSRSRVNTRASAQHVHVTARFRGAAPAQVGVTLKARGVTRSLRVILQSHQGRWTGTLRVPRWEGRGTRYFQIFVGASWNRVRYDPTIRGYSGTDLQALHAPQRLKVVSGSDVVKPRLTSLSFTPDPVDSTTGAARVAVTATATDTRSGVHSVRVTAEIENGSNGVPNGIYPFGVGYLSDEDLAARLRNTADGTWLGVMTVPECVPSGTYRVSATVVDGARNHRTYTSYSLTAAGLPGTLDVASAHGDNIGPWVEDATVPNAHHVRLWFSEGVAHVNTDTLTVYAFMPWRQRYRFPTHVSRIVCRSGGAEVDCSGSDGLVTSAVLTVPDLATDMLYQVYANLGEVTPQVTDGNGNPMTWHRWIGEFYAEGA